MVRGLDVFRGYFAGHADQFVLIGGTAATLAMEDAGLEFRTTKDLDGIKLAEGSHLTPIPLDEAVASLSAILLDDDYYAFIMAGHKESDGLPWVGEDRLIPLKASAWLDLNVRQAKGEAVDTKNIRKHANDVIRLSQLLAPDVRIPLAARIGDDLNRFLDGLAADRSIDPKSLKLNNTVAEIVQRIAQAYELKRAGTQ